MNKKRPRFGFFADAKLELATRKIEGVFRYCQENGCELLDFRLGTMLPDLLSRPVPWRNRVDGIILLVGSYLPATGQQWADWITGGGVSGVSVTADWTDDRVPAVVFDDHKLAKIAARHLLECGCRSFLFFGHQHAQATCARSELWRRELRESKQHAECYTSSWGYRGTFEDEEQIARETRLLDLLKNLPKPLGVWALNDYFAVGIVKACQQLSLAIPEQIQVLGSYDFGISRIQLPMLSSIRVSLEESGYVAAKLLHDLLAGVRVKPITVVRNATLIQRQTTTNGQQQYGNLTKAWQFLQDHACERISVAQLSRVAGSSQRTFQNQFMAKYGCTPHEEIQRVRLQRATQLLRESSLSITQIALMVGYEDIAAFSKFFRKAIGTSPKDYRKQNSPGV